MKDLKRYEIDGSTGYSALSTTEYRSEDGEWVKYDDVKPLLDACVEFVRKCESGEARSTRSYNQMKEAIKIATDDK